MIEFISEHYPTIIALAFTGMFAGTLAGLLGVGGGIIIVPVLFFLFQALGVPSETAMVVATATSLATIVPTSLSSMRAHSAKGNVDRELLMRWGAFVLLGVMLGSWLVTHIDGNWLTVIFGVVAILAALNMFFGNKKALFESLPGRAGQSAMASSVGFFSSLVGIGGGTLTIPMLTFCNYPTHKAVGTSAGVGLLISLPAAIFLTTVANTPADAPAGTVGLVNLIGFACIVPLTVLFAPVGAAIANKLDAAKLKRIMAIVLFFMGIRMLSQWLL